MCRTKSFSERDTFTVSPRLNLSRFVVVQSHPSGTLIFFITIVDWKYGEEKEIPFDRFFGIFWTDEECAGTAGRSPPMIFWLDAAVVGGVRPRWCDDVESRETTNIGEADTVERRHHHGGTDDDDYYTIRSLCTTKQKSVEAPTTTTTTVS